MALKEPYVVKTVIGTDKPTLQADPGEAFMVKNIQIEAPAGNYITLKVEKTTVAYFRVGGVMGSHLPFARGRNAHNHNIKVWGGAPVVAMRDYYIRRYDDVTLPWAIRGEEAQGTDVQTVFRPFEWQGHNEHETLLRLLTKMDLFGGIPVAEGETLIVEGMEDSVRSITLIEYELWEPGDISPDMLNGSKSKQYSFINYGNTGGSIETAGDHIYNTSKNPAEFPDFPFGKVCPAKHNIEISGILGSPYIPGDCDGTNYTRTKFLKMIKDRQVLFDEDRNGLLFYLRWDKTSDSQPVIAEGFSLIGNYSWNDKQLPFIFPEPLVFQPGDELGIYLTTEIGDSAIPLPVDGQEIGLIEKVTRLE